MTTKRSDASGAAVLQRELEAAMPWDAVISVDDRVTLYTCPGCACAVPNQEFVDPDNGVVETAVLRHIDWHVQMYRALQMGRLF